jgi:hypothetical protein
LSTCFGSLNHPQANSYDKVKVHSVSVLCYWLNKLLYHFKHNRMAPIKKLTIQMCKTVNKKTDKIDCLQQVKYKNQVSKT